GSGGAASGASVGGSTQPVEMTSRGIPSAAEPRTSELLARPPHQISNPELALLAVRLDPAQHLLRRARVGEVGGPDLNGGCAGQQKLDRVAGVEDPPDADDRDRDRSGQLPDDAHGDRTQRGAAEPARTV